MKQRSRRDAHKINSRALNTESESTKEILPTQHLLVSIKFPSTVMMKIMKFQDTVRPFLLVVVAVLFSMVQANPIWGCDGNGGACSCGYDGDGNIITMNRFYGDHNDEKVWGCGGAFALTGGKLSGQWGGTRDSLASSMGLDFSQGKSFHGWEGCCYVCGANLQMAGKLSSGWYCEKDFSSTGIWLKGKHR